MNWEILNEQFWDEGGDDLPGHIGRNLLRNYDIWRRDPSVPHMPLGEYDGWTFIKETLTDPQGSPVYKYESVGPHPKNRAMILDFDGKGWIEVVEYGERYYVVLEMGQMWCYTNGIVWSSKQTDYPTKFPYHDVLHSATHLFDLLLATGEHVKRR